MSFWVKYEQLAMVPDGPSSQLSPSFLFIRDRKSLDMTSAHRSPILTFLECQSTGHTWQNLKGATIELFSMYSSASSPGEGYRSVLYSNDVGDGGAALQEAYQVFPSRRNNGKGGRIRPNIEQMAVRRTQDAMNIKNHILAF